MKYLRKHILYMRELNMNIMSLWNLSKKKKLSKVARVQQYVALMATKLADLGYQESENAAITFPKNQKGYPELYYNLFY